MQDIELRSGKASGLPTRPRFLHPVLQISLAAFADERGILGISITGKGGPWAEHHRRAPDRPRWKLAAVSGAFALIFGIVFGIFTADTRRRGLPANAIYDASDGCLCDLS